MTVNRRFGTMAWLALSRRWRGDHSNFEQNLKLNRYMITEYRRAMDRENCVLTLKKVNIGHFMDTKETCKEASQDLARKSLIEISNSLPDKVQNSDVHEVLTFEDKVPEVNGDGADKYRSELISISYSQSPDITLSPVALGNLDG